MQVYNSLNCLLTWTVAIYDATAGLVHSARQIERVIHLEHSGKSSLHDQWNRLTTDRNAAVACVGPTSECRRNSAHPAPQNRQSFITFIFINNEHCWSQLLCAKTEAIIIASSAIILLWTKAWRAAFGPRATGWEPLVKMVSRWSRDIKVKKLHPWYVHIKKYAKQHFWHDSGWCYNWHYFSNSYLRQV